MSLEDLACWSTGVHTGGSCNCKQYLQAILNFGIRSAVFCVLAIAIVLCMSELNRVSIAKSNHRTKQS